MTGTPYPRNMKKGFTLVELLITVGLFVIVITIAVGGFTNAIRTERQVSSLIAAQSNVSLVLEQMSREIRTGYLFCHDAGGATPSSRCNDVNNSSLPTCSVAASTGVWTCPTLDFYDAQVNHVNYSWAGGQLMESVGTNPALSLTGDTITVKYLKFTLFGQTEGDNWPPRITISIGVTPSSTDPAVANDVINLQTTVSSRIIDCNTATNPPQC